MKYDHKKQQKLLTKQKKRYIITPTLYDGAIAIHGRKETASMPVGDFFAQLCEFGVKTVICTDISKDGMMGGSNLELYRGLSGRFAVQLIASGGAGNAGHFTQLFKQVPQVSAGLAASIFHFGELSIANLKKELAENDIEVRI